MSEAETRAWILPHLPREWRQWTAPTYLGRTAQDEDLRAVGGVRFTAGSDGVTVARDALPAEVAAAGHLSSGLWVFLLTDGQIWRSAGALGEPEPLGAVTVPHRIRELRPTLTVAQHGPLTVASRGNALATWGDLPLRHLHTLPAGLVRQILPVSDDELLVLLSGGSFVRSTDRGATWEAPARAVGALTQIRMVEGHVRGAWAHLEPGDARWADAVTLANVPLPHPPPPPLALVRAVIQAYPRTAHTIGVLLSGGGSALLMGEQDVLVAGADRSLEVRWSAVEPGAALTPWQGGVLAQLDEADAALRSSPDGTSWTPVEGGVPWAFEASPNDLWCDTRRQDVLCSEELPGPDQPVSWRHATPDAERFRVTRTDGELIVTRADAMGASGQELGRLPVADGMQARVYHAGDGGPVITSRESYWALNGGLGTLPEGARSAVALVGGTMLAWGSELASIQLRRGDGPWELVAPDAPWLLLTSHRLTCAGRRCVFWHPEGPTVLVEVGERVEALRSRVARPPSGRYVAWPGRRRVWPYQRTPNGFGSLHLRCEWSPSPRPEGALDVQVRRHSFQWGRARSAPHQDPERPIRHAVGTRERLFALFGDAVYSASGGQPPERWAWGIHSAVRSFDAAQEGELWSVMQVLERDATYVIETGRGAVTSFTLRSPAPCYGLGRREGAWGAVVCGEASGTGAFYQVVGIELQIPESVRLPVREDGPLSLCGSPHEDLLRLRMTVVTEGLRRPATVVLEQVPGSAPCVRAVELWGDAEDSEWRGAGRLDVRDDRLVGAVRRRGPDWQRASCELAPP